MFKNLKRFLSQQFLRDKKKVPLTLGCTQMKHIVPQKCAYKTEQGSKIELKILNVPAQTNSSWMRLIWLATSWLVEIPVRRGDPVQIQGTQTLFFSPNVQIATVKEKPVSRLGLTHSPLILLLSVVIIFAQETHYFYSVKTY